VWQWIAMIALVSVCGALALYGLVAEVVPWLRPVLRRGGVVRWPAFVCLMMSCIFSGFALMLFMPWLEKRNYLWVIWAYFGVSVLFIGWSMWRERIGRTT
jgi:hypothetical protein